MDMTTKSEENKEKKKKVPASPSFIVEREVKRNRQHETYFALLLEDARKIQNTVAGMLQRRIRRMWQDPRFRQASHWHRESKALRASGQKEVATELAEQARDVFKKLEKEYRLSQAEAEKDGKEVRTYFHHRLDSVMAQKACLRAWTSAKAYLYRKSDTIHFTRYGENKSVEGKSNKASLRMSPNEQGTDILWTLGSFTGALRPIKSNDLYLQETMALIREGFQPNHPAKQANAELQLVFLNSEMTDAQYLAQWQPTYRIKYTRLVRKRIRGRDRFFMQLTIEGYPVPRRKRDGSFRHTLGKGRVGNDIGLQSIATSANEEVSLQTLAPGSELDEREIRRLQRRLDRQRRAGNPQNYNEKGQIKKGKKTWTYSKRYLKTKENLREMQRKAAIRRKQWHQQEVNRLVGLGNVHVIEKVSWKGLARRAKETKYDPKTGRTLPKKRHGKSVGSRAPGMFVSLYEKKVNQLGGTFHYVRMNTYKASQYDHTTQISTKKDLHQRWVTLASGERVQRDLYSAFLLQHPNEDLSHPDWTACNQHFLSFYLLHQRCITTIQDQKQAVKNSGITV